MRQPRFLAALVVVLIAVVVWSRIDLARSRTPSPSASAEEMAAPLVNLAGLATPAGVRYSVAITKPLDMALQGLSAEVTLPAGAELTAALETPGYTQFLGASGTTLTWAARDYPAGEYIDSFTFLLRQEATGDFMVRVRWSGEPSGEVRFQGRPAVAMPAASVAELVLGPEGTQGGFVPAGASGILVGAAAGLLPEGTRLVFQPLATDADPPASLGNLWWCAAVAVRGVPDGASLLVLVPARQPLPPNAWLDVFTRTQDGWQPVADQQALATFDGQYVAFVHRGGVLAAGTSRLAQPRSASQAPLSTSAASPRFSQPAGGGGGSGNNLLSGQAGALGQIGQLGGQIGQIGQFGQVGQFGAVGGQFGQIGQLGGQIGAFGSTFNGGGKLGFGAEGGLRYPADFSRSRVGATISRSRPSLRLPVTSGAHGVLDMLNAGSLP